MTAVFQSRSINSGNRSFIDYAVDLYVEGESQSSADAALKVVKQIIEPNISVMLYTGPVRAELKLLASATW